ncbi:MAG: hypothetical protein V7717_10640 [Porticoccaceae bacterium]
MTVFVIQDTDGRYLNREAQWNDAKSTVAVFYSPHKDIALNQLLEVNAQDVLLRAQVVACPSNAKGRPVMAVDAAVNNAESATAATTASITESITESTDTKPAAEAETGATTSADAEEQDPEEINDANAA